jgi:hypothetical protein
LLEIRVPPSILVVAHEVPAARFAERFDTGRRHVLIPQGRRSSRPAISQQDSLASYSSAAQLVGHDGDIAPAALATIKMSGQRQSG